MAELTKEEKKLVSKFYSYARQCIINNKTDSRGFDNCFENGAKINDAVVMKLMKYANKPHTKKEFEIGVIYEINGDFHKEVKAYENWIKFNENLKLRGYYPQWQAFYLKNTLGI